MTEKDVGIILRVRPYSDTSLIVHWLTCEQGRLATMARGARRPKSPFRGKLDLFFGCRIQFRKSSRSDLHQLNEVVIEESRPWLRTRYDCLQAASVAVSLVELVTETDTPVPEIHEQMEGLLTALKTTDAPSVTLGAFEAGFLHEQGFLPDPEDTGLGKEEKSLLGHWLSHPLVEAPVVKPDSSSFRKVAMWLQSVMIHEFGRLPKGRSQMLDL